MIELRSDTFTLPTDAMRDAAYHAALGDDVWGEDPTVQCLEARVAELMGKDAAVFVPSGTMGNLAALLSHTERGDEVIVGDQSHIFLYEVAGGAVVGGLQLRSLPNTHDGRFELETLRRAIRPQDIHQPRTTLICVENTHNRCGGAVLDEDFLAHVRTIAADAGCRVHMDGARIFNAAVALGLPARRLAEYADSVSFCLSKALSAPVGSVLCGSRSFIASARRWRKLLGGGMRQVGVLAAPGLVALDTMVDRLAEDHAHARMLGHALSEIPGVHVNLDTLRTNIVIADIRGVHRAAAEVVSALAARGLYLSTMGPTTLRLVTHRGVSADDVEQATRILAEVLAPSGVARAV